MTRSDDLDFGNATQANPDRITSYSVFVLFTLYQPVSHFSVLSHIAPFVKHNKDSVAILGLHKFLSSSIEIETIDQSRSTSEANRSLRTTRIRVENSVRTVRVSEQELKRTSATDRSW
jgi:hypothetical protein